MTTSCTHVIAHVNAALALTDAVHSLAPCACSRGTLCDAHVQERYAASSPADRERALRIALRLPLAGPVAPVEVA